MKFTFLQSYCQTILEIIEEKPNYTIPIQLYQLIILIFFLQLLGYCLTNYESKQFFDEKIGSVSRANEIASMTFVIFQKGNDLMTIGFFIIVQIVVYSYFLYVAILSFLRNKKRYIYTRYQSVFKTINQVLNTYFTLYDWIFFIPILEINFGMLFCGRRSFLIEMREDNCSISIQYKIFGYIGAFLGLITTLITSFFFRNYQFEETNKLKRKFNRIMTVQLFLKCSLSLIYYVDSDFTDTLKFMVSIILSVVCLADSIWNIPFRDRQIIRFYATCSSYYFCITLISTIWIFGEGLIHGNELFYYIILFGIVCQGVALVLVDYRFNSVIKGNYAAKGNNTRFIFNMIDLYLEQIMKLTLESSHNEESKCKLIEIMMLHYQNCIDKQCLCKQNDRNYIIKKVRADLNYFCDLINCMFQWALAQKGVLENRDDIEHLTLKYISFLYKFYGNSPRAYYELKLYLSKKVGSSSYYFIMIAKVISSAIETQIDWRRMGSADSQKGSSMFSQRNQELTVYTILAIESICEKYIPQIMNCIQWKIDFWEKMLVGYNSMDDFQDKCLQLTSKIDRMNNQFHFKLKQINNFVQQYDSYQLKKLKQMFYLLVMNDTLKAQKLDEEGEDLKTRDMLKNAELVHTTNFIKGNIQTVLISLSKSTGKIISKKDKKFLEFFGYEKEEADQVRKINDLMPNYIGRLHDQFLKHYVKRGSSNLIQNNQYSFMLYKSGFIQQIKLYIDYIFTSQDDFQMAATILKINSAYDYLVFDRQGVIVGLTQNLLQKLFSQLKRIPLPNQIVNKYFTFLFFSEILKTFRAKREEILKNIESGEPNIQLDLSKKGWFNLNESYEEVLQQLMSYIDYCKKNPKDIKSFVDIDNLDLLDEESLNFLEQFQAFRLLQRNIGFKPSNQSISSRGLRSKIGWSTESKSLRMFTIKLFFKYTLHLSQFDLNRSQGASKKDVFFILKFHDLTINKKVVGQKMQFTKSMITYLGATTSIGLLSQFGTQLSKLPTLQLTNSKEFQNIRQSINSNQSSSSKFKDIPIKMITSLVRLKSTASNNLAQQDQKLRESLTDISNKLIGANQKANKLHDEERIKADKQEKEIKNRLFRSIVGTEQNIESEDQSRDDENTENKNGGEGDDGDEEEDVVSIDEEQDQEVQKKKEQQVATLLKNMNIKEEYEKSHSKQLTDQILQKFTISEDYIKVIDPNYHIKKAIQSNSRLSKFSIALENAILEAQFELMQEKKILETVKSLVSSKDSSGLNNNNNNQYPQDLLSINRYDSQNIMTNRFDSTNQILPPNPLKSDSTNSLIKQDSNKDYNNPFSKQLSISSNSKNSKNKYDLSIKDSVKQNSGGLDSPSIFKNVSQDLSPISNKEVRTGATNKKSQFVQNYSKYLSNDSMIRSFIQQQDSSYIDDTSPKPIFQNPNDMAYTFRESLQRVNTPSLDNLDKDSDVSSNEKKDKMSTKKSFKNIVQKANQGQQANGIKDLLLQDSNIEDNSNLEFKFQKSLEQEEDIDGQLEEIRTQKEKKQKNKKSAKYQMSVKQSSRSRNRTHVSMSQHNIQIDLLKQKGLKNEEGHQNLFEGSVKSTSSSTRTRYGGIFLRVIYHQFIFVSLTIIEILLGRRVPAAAKQYQLLLFFFFAAFITLNMVNLNIIQSSMNDFRNYVAIVRVPRQFQRQYSVSFMGEYAKFQLNNGYLTDDSNKSLLALAETFKSRSYNAYNGQYTNNSQIVSESWESIKSDEYFEEDYVVYQNEVSTIEKYSLNMIYMKVLTKMLLLQKNQTAIQQRDSFLFLRRNFLKFSDNVDLQIGDLVKSVKATVDSLTNSFTSTTLSAIISLVLVGLLFFPLVYWINKYQEQILMIVSRIYKEQAEIERNKYTIIKQLIDYEKWDWLRYNYNGILWIKYDQFDVRGINQKSKIQDRQVSTNKRSQNLQSLIFIQKLSVFRRIWMLLLMVAISVTYFAFIIVYIYTQNPILKFPVIKNFTTFKTHLSFNKIKVCGSIVAFDRYLTKLINHYDISDIDKYRDCLYDSMNELNTYMDENKSMVYDESNPLPSENRQTGKDLFEGNICKIVTTFPCQENDITSSQGLSQIFSIMQKCLISFPAIFNYTSTDPLNESQIKNFINDDCNKLYFFKGFNRQDEVIHLFSSNINASISTISDDISNFLNSYLTILGILLAVLIAIFVILNWFFLRKRILLMNLLLTIIPEEKLSEEIILNMLKQLRYQ